MLTLTPPPGTAEVVTRVVERASQSDPLNTLLILVFAVGVGFFIWSNRGTAKRLKTSNGHTLGQIVEEQHELLKQLGDRTRAMEVREVERARVVDAAFQRLEHKMDRAIGSPEDDRTG